ncbi:MAG: hypothetical protein ACFFAH_06655, partial [Promethearchaeota archaeon]
KLDKDREEILRVSRKIIRDCSIAIKSVHRKEFDVYKEQIDEIKVNLSELANLVNKNPGIFFKYLKTPEQEYAEAVCFYSIVNHLPVPKPNELKINSVHYLLGLADVIGELRRYALDNIRNSQIEDLDKILEDMDEIYTSLFSLDYPSGITQDLRHKTDVGRNIIEKTRGDISLTLRIYELKECIDEKLKDD